VIKVYGFTGVETGAGLTTKAEPNGAGVTKRKSEAKGISKREAPVSNVGRVGANLEPTQGTELEVVAVAEATTVGATMAVAEELTVAKGLSPTASWQYR